jgi:hypothetical protein
VPGAAQQEISSVLVYLLDVHGVKAVRAVLGDAMPPINAHRSRGRAVPTNTAEDIMRSLGMRYVNPWENPHSENFSYAPWQATPHATPIGGAAYHVRLDGQLPATFVMENERWTFRQTRHGAELTTEHGSSLEFALDTLVVFAKHSGGVRDTLPAPMLTGTGVGIRGTLVPDDYSGLTEADTLHFYSLAGDLYLTPVHP